MTFQETAPQTTRRKKLQRLRQQTDLAMTIDRYPLRDRIHRLEKRRQKKNEPDENIDAALEKLAHLLDRSIARRQARAEHRPIPDFSLALPVVENRQKVADLLNAHQVIVLCGETGSGKTTQLPKICLALGRGTEGLIGMTQPRRIAARSIAQFIAQDLRQSSPSPMPHAVGYKMRFTDQVRPDTFIKVMTDGILLAEIQGDRYLNAYDTLIIDEAHERSLNIDFLLGYLKRILPSRPDLKLIISSATLDTDKFSRHFDGAPVIEISGRTYPVEVRYRPLAMPPTGNDPDTVQSTSRQKELEEAVVDAVRELSHQKHGGDILVFLPGEREIRESLEALHKQRLPDIEVLPLFARLSSADQDRIFQPGGGRRRIILATNVAETSLTVPGIRYVIDSGLARISRQGGRGQVRRLPIEKISQSSANQRKGRCGRLSDGICIRLYDQDDFEERPLYTDAEILRTSLDAAILQMKAQRLGEVEQFPFVDPPPTTAIREGFRSLETLGAIDAHGKITAMGRQLAKLPLDPRMARMILAAKAEGSLTEILILAAALSIPDPREVPREMQEKAKQLHQRHRDNHSDFISFLTLWHFIEDGRNQATSKSQFRKFLKENCLSFTRIREWEEIHRQLSEQVREMGWQANRLAADYLQIHRAILAGLLGQIGFKAEKHEFLGPRQIRFHINPGSALFKKPPTWIMAAELVETSRLFARICAKLEPEWIESVAGPLCKRHYFEAHWEKKQGCVMAYEKVSLFGVVLITRRKIPYGPIDPEESRRLFIQSALVEGELQTNAPFFSHNHGLITEIRDLEHKSRRRDLLVDEQTLFHHYEEILPQNLYTADHFHHWYQHARKKNQQILYFDKERLMRHEGESITGERFPGHLQIQGREYPLEYHFSPGEGEDGVSVLIPLPYLNQVSPFPFEWLVPGLLADKMLALLKLLPKIYRRSLVPLPQTVELCLNAGGDRNQPLCATLGLILAQKKGVVIPIQAWRYQDLPDHLLMNFKIVDEDGQKLLNQGRQLEHLQGMLGKKAQDQFTHLPKGDFEKKHRVRWDFGPLPRRIDFTVGHRTINGFPALVDEGSSVSLRLLDNPNLAQQTTRRGLIRLFALQLPQQIKQIKRNITLGHEALLAYLPMGKKEKLHADIIDLAIERIFLPPEAEEVQDEEPFNTRLQSGRHKVIREAGKIAALCEQILLDLYQVRLKMKTAPQSPALKAILPEIQEQLDQLIGPDFLWKTPEPWLSHLPRFLKAIQLRMERRAQDPNKDRLKMAELTPLWKNYLDITKKQTKEGVNDPERRRYYWMLEEFRVSLFAQELKTSLPVSVKRLEAQWQKILQ